VYGPAIGEPFKHKTNTELIYIIKLLCIQGFLFKAGCE